MDKKVPESTLPPQSNQEGASVPKNPDQSRKQGNNRRRDDRYQNVRFETGGGRPARVFAKDTKTGRPVQGSVGDRNNRGEVRMNQVNSPRDRNQQRVEQPDPNRTRPLSTEELPKESVTTDTSQDKNKTRPLSESELDSTQPQKPETSSDSSPENTSSEKRPLGYVSPYETPAEKDARLKRTREDTDDINQLKRDGSNRVPFNEAAFGYRDPNFSQQSQNKESNPTPNPEIPTEINTEEERNKLLDKINKLKNQYKDYLNKIKNKTGSISERVGDMTVAETLRQQIARLEEEYARRFGNVTPEPTPPTPPEPKLQETPVGIKDGKQVMQTILPGFDVTSFPEEPIPGGPAVEVNPRMEPIGRDSQGNIIEQGNMFSLGKQKEAKQPSPEPVKEPEETEGPIVLDALIQQGTQSELYSAKMEAVRNRGDEIEAANMGSYVNYSRYRDRFINFISSIPAAIRGSWQRTAEEVSKSRDLSSKDALDIIFDSKNLDEQRRLQDQITQEGAALLANDLLSAAASQSKFEKVYESLDGNPEFEAAKAELVLLIKKYSVRDPKTGLFPDRDSFEKEKNAIVEKIIKLAPESTDKDALENTIDGFWNNIEVLRAKNLSAEKIAQMEIILNIKIARGSFLRQTEIQKNLSNNLAETIRNTSMVRWLPARYRDVVAVAIPLAFTGLSRVATSPLALWATFGVSFLASGLTTGAVEKKRKFDETDTTRRILARSIAGGGDPREILARYNPDQISGSVNQLNITNLTTNLEFALKDLDSPSGDPKENDRKIELLLDLLAKYMAIVEQSTKDKFDYFTAGSEQELIASKAKAAQLALQIRNRINELKTAGNISIDVNTEFKARFQKASADFENINKLNNELFETLQSRISTGSAINRGVAAAVMSAIFGVSVHGADRIGESIASTPLYQAISESIVKNVAEPGTQMYQDIVARMGFDININPAQLLTQLQDQFSGGVPDHAQPEYTNLPHATTTEQALSQNLTHDQARGWFFEQATGTQEVHHGLTAETCDPSELTTTTERSLSVSEIMNNPEKYPTQYADIIKNGAYHYSGGHWDHIELNGGEAWNKFLGESDVVDKSQLFSISDPVDQVEAMGTETHSYWADGDRNVLNITGRDFVKGPNGEFLDHTHRILEDGTKEYYREILPFNDFLESKVESGNFDVMVYLKDGNVVKVPSEYISVTDNGVSVDFRNVPGIVGEIWKSGNLGLAEAVRYGYTTDTGSHALVSTIEISGPTDDLSIVKDIWNPGNVTQTNYSTIETITKDCPSPTPIPTPEGPNMFTPIILPGPGVSGKEQRYEFKGDVDPNNGTIKNERVIKSEKLPSIVINPTKLKAQSSSPEFAQDPQINGKLGVVETLAKASVQASAILELLNKDDERFFDAIMDSKSMLITNLDILITKIDKLIKVDKKYDFLREDLNRVTTILRFLKSSKVRGTQYDRDAFQTGLKQIINQYLGKFYVNPTIQVPKVDYPNQAYRQQPIQPTQTTEKVEVTPNPRPDTQNNTARNQDAVQTIIPGFEPQPTQTSETQPQLTSNESVATIAQEKESENNEVVEFTLEDHVTYLSMELDKLIRTIKSGQDIATALRAFEIDFESVNSSDNVFKGTRYEKYIKELFDIINRAKNKNLDSLVLEDGSEVPGNTESEKLTYLLQNNLYRFRKKKAVAIIERKEVPEEPATTEEPEITTADSKKN